MIRPKDQPLWQHNHPDTLRYLVVDELHTFDGAQGTDLACLIRRLRHKLGIGDDLACVGTSATIGGDDSIVQLVKYARQIFSQILMSGQLYKKTVYRLASFCQLLLKRLFGLQPRS